MSENIILRKRTSFLFLTFLLACQLPPPGTKASAARAQSGSGTQTNRQVEYLKKRVDKLVKEDFRRLSKAVEDSERLNRQTKADLSVLIQDLRNETQTLRGALDVLQHDVNAQNEKNKRIQQDLDARISELESKLSSSANKVDSKSEKEAKKTAKTNIDAISRYNQILRIILDRKDYDTAIVQFRQFLKTYPDTTLAANAQYWLGEGHFAKGEYRKAIGEFQKVVDKYPKSEKVCDAILKQGFSFEKIEDKKNAKLFLTEVTARCPKTKAASRAQKSLKVL